jgi:hypothetical protein
MKPLALTDGPLGPPSELDRAAARMQAAPDDAAARLGFIGALITAEVFVWLEAETDAALKGHAGQDGQAQGRIRPRVLDLSEGRAVLCFDSEARLAGFAGQGVSYAALPGRVLVSMLAADGGLMLVLNPDGPAPAVVDAPMLHWAQATFTTAPEAAEVTTPFEGLAPPLDPKALSLLAAALERRLRGAPGLGAAVLAGARWQAEGAVSLVLALGGVPGPVQPPLAQAAAEAAALSGALSAALSGAQAPDLDVIFPDAAAMARLSVHGRALDITAPRPPEPAPQSPPGMDPQRPPRLR